MGIMVVTKLHTPVTLEFENLSYSVPDNQNKLFGVEVPGYMSMVKKKKKKILHNVSGIFRPGELTAIMGPSGSSKSTLMNVLAGYRKENIEGTVYVNGKPRDSSRFRRISCYVMQDDVHLPNLTVLESMNYAAELTLHSKTSHTERDALTHQIVGTMGLWRCKDVMASLISGGERKRLSIGLELINNPAILFLDEPVSGLDSVACTSCINLLKSLASGGRTIVATIHQPSAKLLEKFDSLFILSEGKNIYRGPTQELVSYFGDQGLICPEYHNPADFAIEVAIGDYGHEWIDLLAKATGNKPVHTKDQIQPVDQLNDSVYENNLENCLEDDDDAPSPRCTYPIRQLSSQFVTLLKRSFVCVLRDMMLTRIRFAATLLIGLLIGATFNSIGNDASQCFNNVGNLVFSLLFIVFSAMMTTTLTFPLERKVLLREHLNCWYSLKSYYLARSLADLPFQLFFPIFFILMTYYMTDQPPELMRLGIVLLVGTLASLVAQTMGLVIGAFFDVESAVFFGPICQIPFFVFCGGFATISSIPAFLRWMSYISYVRYTFQSILTAIYGLNRDQLTCPPSEEYCHFKNPEKFLEFLENVDIPVARYAACVAGILLFLRIMAYWVLRWRIKSGLK